MNKTSNKKARMRIGWNTFAALAGLTIIEFVISVYLKPSTPYLIATSLIKAWLIISYFMHVNQIWQREEEHE